MNVQFSLVDIEHSVVILCLTTSFGYFYCAMLPKDILTTKSNVIKYELQYCYYIKHIYNQYTYTKYRMNVILSILLQNTLKKTSSHILLT